VAPHTVRQHVGVGVSLLAAMLAGTLAVGLAGGASPAETHAAASRSQVALVSNPSPRPDQVALRSAAHPLPTPAAVEREYTVPVPRTAEEVISYYAKRIAQDVKPPSQFSALAPKVREFLEVKAFGERIDLSSAGMIRAIATPVAVYLTIKTFAGALRGLVIEELIPTLEGEGRKLSDTEGYPFSRPTLDARKTIFNLVAPGNEYEREFAQFLENSADVEAFAKLPPTSRLPFSIEYTDNTTNVRYYEPDFVAALLDGTRWLIETKGREDIDVAHKDRAAHIWCENATLLTGVSWTYVKVRQAEFAKLQPGEFSQLAVAFA